MALLRDKGSLLLRSPIRPNSGRNGSGSASRQAPLAAHPSFGALRLAQDDPRAATVALAPVIDGSTPVTLRVSVIQALLLEAAAHDALGDPDAAGRALEGALDLAEPDGAVLPFLLYAKPGLLERRSRHRTSHASLVFEILRLLAGASALAPAPGQPQPLREPLTDSETRILRYLPTNLSAQEIADELYLSWNTVRTHMRHLYAKLDAHHRQDAVERGRALGLLAPSWRRREAEAPARLAPSRRRPR